MRLFVALGITRHVQELTYNYPFVGSFWEIGSKFGFNYIWTSCARVRTLHILTFIEPNTKHYLRNIIDNRVLIRWLTWTVEPEPSFSLFCPHYLSRKKNLRLSLEYFLPKLSEDVHTTFTLHLHTGGSRLCPAYALSTDQNFLDFSLFSRNICKIVCWCRPPP